MFKETNDSYKIDIEIQCRYCRGTGLFIGMSERDGAAVVCQNCKGTGKDAFKRTFSKYKGRLPREDVERVFSTAAGYVISAKDVTREDGKACRFSKYGVKYSLWLKGVKPKPIEDLHCPYQHTSQNMQLPGHPAHNLYQERCYKQGLWGMMITDCKLHPDMAICWKRYHELVENKNEASDV